MRTAQQLFDTVVNHLRQQNSRSTNGDDACLYRDLQGRKCALGCLIPDENYLPDMESKTLSGLLRGDLLPISLRDELTTHLRLLSELQNTHDYVDVQFWEERFQNVAKDFGLEYPPRG